MTASSEARNARASEGAIRRDPLWIAAQFVLLANVIVPMLAMDPFAGDTFALPKSALGHAVSLVLLSLFVALFLRHGPPLLRLSWIHAAAIAVLLASAAASAGALDQTVAVFGAPRRYLGLTEIGAEIFLFFATAALIRTVGDVIRLLAAVTAGLIPMLLYGVIQHAGLDPIKYELSTSRPIATLGQPDVLAGFLAIVSATYVAVLLVSWRRSRPLVRWGLVAVLAVALAVMLFTEVRNVLLGMGAGILVIMAIAATQGITGKLLRTRRRQLIAAGFLAAALIVFALSPAAARLRPAALADDPALQARADGWRAALALTAARPILGLGPDNFVVAYPGVRSELSVIATSNETLNSTHNWLMHVLVGTGVTGALAFLVCLALVAMATLRLARRGSVLAFAAVPIAAYLGQGLVDVNDVGLDWIPWVAAGVIASAEGIVIRRPASWPKLSIRSEVAIAAALLGVALLFAGPTLGRVRASEAAKGSEAYARQLQIGPAVDLAREALALDNRRGEYWNVFGGALAAAGNPSAAYTAFIDGTQREPWQAILWRNAALSKVRAGDPRGGLAAARQALKQDRLDVESLNIVARLTFNFDDYASALEAGLLAVRLQPNDSSLYVVPALAYSALGKTADAEEMLRAGIRAGGSADLHVLLGQLLANTGRVEDAIAEIDAALAIDPNNQAIQAIRQSLVRK